MKANYIALFIAFSITFSSCNGQEIKKEKNNNVSDTTLILGNQPKEDIKVKYDFYKNDFFHERFMNNMQQMERLFWEMDSIENKFFMEQFPEKGKNE